MNKMAKMFIGFFVFCLVLVGTGFLSGGYGENFQSGQAGVFSRPISWDAFRASWLIGHRVITPTAEGELGQITGLVIDETNRHVALLILSDVPNMGGKRMAIPFSSITEIGQGTVKFNPGTMRIGPSLEPNYVTTMDPYIYALTIANRPPAYVYPTSDVSWLANIYARYGQVPYWVETGEPAPGSLVLTDSSRLLLAKVRLTSGEAAGEIEDLVITRDGRIAFFILTDVPGKPRTLVAVPFTALSIQGNAYVLNIGESQLVNTPAFNDSYLSKPSWATDVYRYYGMEPYWTDRAEMAPSPAPVRPENPNPNSMDYIQKYGY